jgi:hypothetical protein
MIVQALVSFLFECDSCGLVASLLLHVHYVTFELLANVVFRYRSTSELHCVAPGEEEWTSWCVAGCKTVGSFADMDATDGGFKTGRGQLEVVCWPHP